MTEEEATLVAEEEDDGGRRRQRQRPSQRRKTTEEAAMFVAEEEDDGLMWNIEDVEHGVNVRERETVVFACRDYTNPYLPVNPTAIEGFVQPAVGPDGKKKEPESTVLLASIENMQYAVTVDVLHTVFSAFGTVQKIAIFEKNGGTQALIQYSDVTTAAVAKDALEGHCIYDGGYCKLHLSYSRHTDLNVKAYSDKSRDYTIPESSLVAMQQAPGLPAAPTVWQNRQPAPMFPGSEFAAGGAVPAQAPTGQVQSWDPNMQAGRQNFVSAPGTFHSQTYAPSSFPAYAAAPTPGSHQSNMRPGGATPPGQPSYYR